jgi:ATP-dependent Clp protease ATP-binding subunit ClpA
VLRASDPFVQRQLEGSRADPGAIELELMQFSQPDKVLSTSVEIPFSPEVTRVLQHAVIEADRLHHSSIEPAHLLLGMLREQHGVAASVLSRHGIALDAVRAALAAPVSDVSTNTGIRPSLPWPAPLRWV